MLSAVKMVLRKINKQIRKIIDEEKANIDSFYSQYAAFRLIKTNLVACAGFFLLQGVSHGL